MNKIDTWISDEQAKNRLCACGCGSKIKITRDHHSKGIPKFIKNHYNPMLGKKHTDTTIQKMKQNHCDVSGKNNPMFGVTFSEKHRDKISKSNKKKLEIDKWIKDNQGKHFCICGCGTEIKITRGHYQDGIPERILKHMNGKNHPSWKGGISFEPYCHKFNNQLKERIRERDNRTCQKCGVKENGIKLTCHHIHYDKENCYPDLITLCHSCNSKANGNRDYWEEYYMNILETRGLLNWS